MAVGNALHPTLYHTGRGAWHKADTACDEAHFRKLRLTSINPKFRAAQEVETSHPRAQHTRGKQTLAMG
eukprot:5120858-Prymnesium_polylepis.1